MASTDDLEDDRDKYIDTLTRQTNYFQQQFGCSTSPSFYMIHYHDGAAHWSTYQWGWDLRYLNLEKGDRTQCGKAIGRGIAICQKCYTDKREGILEVCRKFDRELKENHQETINKEIEEGKKIRIIRTK